MTAASANVGRMTFFVWWKGLRLPGLLLFIVIACRAAVPINGLKSPEIELPEEEWVSCKEYKETLVLANCLCMVTEDELHFKVNCDHVVFGQDFPPLPFRQPIISFSQRFVNYQNVPPQALLASKVPLQSLDLSHNWLRRFNEKSMEGLGETLENLDLSHNLLGDQLNPIFSSSEFKRLPKLRTLKLGSNLLFDIDGGIFEGLQQLQELHLDNNDMRKVPKTTLRGPTSLKILNLGSNRIDDLSPDDFVSQRTLLFLNISDNLITTIQGNAFRGLSSLKFVDLSRNRIQRLNSDAFLGLSTIEVIDLSYNFFSQIPIAALRGLTSLRGLRLSGNLIQNLEGTNNLKSLDMLEKLDLSRNRLSEIPRGFFSGMSRLKEINLGVNQLRTMPSNVFEGLPNLERLHLADNNLLTFPAAALAPVTQTLTWLNLDYNRISALVPMKIANLTKLSISNNLIREIPPETFHSSFPSLAHLDLHGNLIEKMDEVILPPTLKFLDLGLNSLKTVPRFALPELEVLKLSRNSLPAILQHNFVLLNKLRSLDLSSNVISTFFPNTFDGLEKSLEDLDLSGNLMETLPQKFGDLIQLRNLNFSRNNLRDVGKLQNMDNLKTLDLSSNQISNLTPDIFSNMSALERIDLSRNKMNSFKGFMGTFERLRVLNLDNNDISYVYPNSFENFNELWILDLHKNRFTFFPTEFLRNCKQLRLIQLSQNHIKNLNEMNFSGFPHLRKVDLSQNFLEFILSNSFSNSSQIQYLDFSSNKLESLDGNMLQGLYRLELDLSNNYLASLPPSIFERSHVHKLQKINLAKNTFQSIPSDSLQKQYFYLEYLDLSDNQITEVPQNLNILVNVKSLDLSNNPIDDNSLKNILNEPKTARWLSLSNTNLKRLPILEMPFLRHLNLSGNSLSNFDEAVFKRTTLLQTLSMERNQIVLLDTNFPPSLTYLDLSKNPITNVNGNSLPQSLQTLKLNDLENLLKVEKSALNLKNLITIELYNLQKLGYLDIRGILGQLPYLENFDFEVKDHQIVDQVHPGLNGRVKSIGLRGRRVRSISTGAFAGLTSPDIKISLINTSLTLLPSILVPVPMSSNIVLDLHGSKITNLSPPFLSQNIKLEGLNPVCDCNAINLVKCLKSVASATGDNGEPVICSAPRKLAGRSIMEIGIKELVCDAGGSTTPPPIVSPTPLTTTTTTTSNSRTTPDDIIWSLPPKNVKKHNHNYKSDLTTSHNHNNNNKKLLDSNQIETSATTKTTRLKAQDISNMDNLIIGIVGGVVGLIVLFVFMIVCFVKMTNNGSGGNEHDLYPAAAPSVISVAPYGGPASSKCTCPHGTISGNMAMNMGMNMNGHGHGHGHGGGYTLKGNGGPIYGGQYMTPTSYSTVRSQGKLMHNREGGGGGSGYPSLPTFSGVYGTQGNMNSNGSTYMGQPGSSYGYNNNTMGHSSLRAQQQMYTSLPYHFVQDEF